MTPDFLAGLLIGSFLVYACWLLSLPEPPDPEDRRTFDFPGKAHILPRPKGPRPKPATQPPDPIGDALIFLGEALSDDA